MKQVEPPSSRFRANDPLFFIGRNSRGNWVAQDQRHICGGLFVDQTQAFRFALVENGNRPDAVILVPGVLELDMSGTARPAHQPDIRADDRGARRAA
jgi:hypothetical protein